jgi:hypothetical protein
MIPHGSLTDVALTATAETHAFSFDGRRLKGTLSALVRRNEKTDEATPYDLTFDGLAVGSDVSGTVKVVREGEDLGEQVFQGGITTGAPDPGDALYRVTLHRAIPKHNHLNVLFTVREGKILGGFGVSPHFNNAIHGVDFSAVRLESGRLAGPMRVTITPDAWVPRDHKPVPCGYELDAEIVDGELMGRFTGQFGATEVTGSIEGATDPKPAIKQVSKMTLKVENGVFGRAFITMHYENGELGESHIWNNHDRGMKGSVDEADLDCSDERIRGTLSLRTGRSQGELPAYTCKVDGVLVGTMGAGTADTATAEGRRKKSTFWVAVTPDSR